MSAIVTGHRQSTAGWVGQIATMILCVATARAVATAEDAKGPAETETVKEQRAQRLVEMRAKAAEFTWARSKSQERKSLELRAEPIFRYSDQPRGFVDATLWAWDAAGGLGRPAAVAKVEVCVGEAKTPYWQFCIASLADEPITADFANVRRLSARRPAFDLRPLPKAPQPADKPTGRQRQMKNIVARFAATIDAQHLNTKELVKQEMRLLPSPIYHYADEINGLLDGTIFGLTTNGTNPDMLIVIELRGTEVGSAVWNYGIVKMTDAEVHVRIDREEVWASMKTEPRETWTYFQEGRREK